MLLSQFKQFILGHGERSAFFRNLSAQGRVLDIGCGRGANGVALTSFHPELEVHGIDLIDDGSVPSFIAYKQVDLNKCVLPYPDGYFDAIVCTHVIEHLSSPMGLGSELNRILKPGGKIYVEAPNWTAMLVPSFGFKREQHDPFNFFDDPTHLKPWTKHGLFELLSAGCGLDVETIDTTRNWRRIIFDPAILLYGLIRGKRGLVVSSCWNLVGWCVYGIARKK